MSQYIYSPKTTIFFFTEPPLRWEDGSVFLTRCLIYFTIINRGYLTPTATEQGHIYTIHSLTLYSNIYRDLCQYVSRDSAVGVATGYGLDDSEVGVRVPVGSRIITSPRRPNGFGVHPTSYPKGTGSSFPGVKRPGREVNHSPPTSAEVKKMWIYTSTPPYAFMA
jgi:hypothetical protein